MADPTPKNYEEIPLPYNDLLERTEPNTATLDGLANQAIGDTTMSNATGGGNGNVEEQPVKTDGGMGDLWIKNFIRSTNWSPKKVGFYIDGLTGYAEFSNVYISGNITALTGTIGGWTINATTLSATTMILDAGNQSIRSTNYVSGVFGSGFHLDSNLLEVGNIAARGLIRTAAFQKDVVNVMGGSFAVLDGGVLTADMSVSD